MCTAPPKAELGTETGTGAPLLPLLDELTPPSAATVEDDRDEAVELAATVESGVLDEACGLVLLVEDGDDGDGETGSVVDDATGATVDDGDGDEIDVDEEKAAGVDDEENKDDGEGREEEDDAEEEEDDEDNEDDEDDDDGAGADALLAATKV